MLLKMTMHAQQTLCGYMEGSFFFSFFVVVSKNYTAVQQFLVIECFVTFVWNGDKRKSNVFMKNENLKMGTARGYTVDGEGHACNWIE